MRKEEVSALFQEDWTCCICGFEAKEDEDGRIWAPAAQDQHTSEYVCGACVVKVVKHHALGTWSTGPDTGEKL